MFCQLTGIDQQIKNLNPKEKEEATKAVLLKKYSQTNGGVRWCNS